MGMFRNWVIVLGIVLGVAKLGWCQEGGFVNGNWFSHDSNRVQVRERLHSDNWVVIYGKAIEEGDMAVLAACTYFGCLGEYFDYYIDETQQRIQRQLPGISREIFIQLLEQAFREKGRVFSYLGLELNAGIATYSRWKRIVNDEPRTRKVKIQPVPGGPWTWGFEPYLERVEREIPLPNHHQPYFRFRIFMPTGGGEPFQTQPGTRPPVTTQPQQPSGTVLGPSQTPPSGYPSGYGMLVCGCWLPPNPPQFAAEPRCQSGKVRLGTCPGFCPPNGIPYGYVCQ